MTSFLTHSKEKAAIEKSYKVIQSRTNSRGVPASGKPCFERLTAEWCVWKLNCSFYPMPEDLEAAEWFKVRTFTPFS